jgi:hypothetical protein
MPRVTDILFRRRPRRRSVNSMRSVLLPVAFALALATPVSAAEPPTGCGNVGRGDDRHAVSKRGPVSCRRARHVIRVRVLKGRTVAGWRCSADRQGLVVGWNCRRGESFVTGAEPSETL